jgi:hypothetical protein
MSIRLWVMTFSMVSRDREASERPATAAPSRRLIMLMTVSIVHADYTPTDSSYL